LSANCLKECEDNTTCFSPDACTRAYCDTSPNVFKCVFEDISDECNDNNGCTKDSCDQQTGCVYEDISSQCDDNDACTTDICDNTSATFRCINISKDCSYLNDECNLNLCNSFETNLSLICVKSPIVCPRDNNCTYAQCLFNYTDEKTQQNISGCKNTTLDCAFNIGAVVAGLVGGAIAGIVIAAAILVCGAMAGGGAYAISQTSAGSDHTKVSINPLYKGSGKGSAGIAG